MISTTQKTSRKTAQVRQTRLGLFRSARISFLVAFLAMGGLLIRPPEPAHAGNRRPNLAQCWNPLRGMRKITTPISIVRRRVPILYFPSSNLCMLRKTTVIPRPHSLPTGCDYHKATALGFKPRRGDCAGGQLRLP